MKKRWLLLTACFIVFLAANCSAQSNVQLDSSFTTPGFYITQGAGMISASAAQPDGKMILAGNFIKYNGQSCTNLIRLNTDGTLDTTFDRTAGTNGDIMAISVQPDGKIILSGSFTTFKGNPTNRNFIRLKANGTYDSTFSAPVHLKLGYASADHIAVQPDGKLLLSGFGVKTSNVTVCELVRLNANGTVDNTFDVNTHFENYQLISTLTVQPDGKIWVAGNFASFGGVNQKNIIRLHTNGSIDNSFQCPGNGFLNNSATDLSYVTALLPLKDGSVLAGGSFYYCDNYLSPGVVHLLADGKIDQTFNTHSAFMPYGITKLDTIGNKILAGGVFYADNHQYMLLQLNSNGSVDPGFQTVTNDNRTNTGYDLQTFTVLPDKSINIAGGFNFYVQDKPYTGIAHLQADGTLDKTLSPAFQKIGAVYKTLVTRDGKIMVGGSFHLYGNTPVNNLVRLLPSGALDPSFQTGSGPDALVTDIAELKDSTLIIAGDFKTVNGASANGMAKLTKSGTLYPNFSTGTGPDFTIYSLLPLANGHIMVGGAFSQFNNYVSQGLVRLLPDGSVDQRFRSPANAPWYSIGSMAALNNRQLLVGDNSDRTMHDYSSPFRVWKLNDDGTVDHTFNTNAPGGFPITRKLAVTPQHNIYYSGEVIFAGTPEHFTQSLVKLNEDGSNDNSANAFPATFYVQDFKLLGDSAILACGRNLGWNDSANYIMRFKPDLSIDSSFNPVAVYYDLKSIDYMRDGRIVIAGEPVRFFRLAAEPIPNIALLKGTSLQISDNKKPVPNMLGTINVGTNSMVGVPTTTQITIYNRGSTTAILGDGANHLAIIEGADAAAFSIGSDLTSGSITKKDSITLTIRFTPTSPGAKKAQITIPYNNGVKQKYTFTMQGTATSVVTAIRDVTEESNTAVYPNPSTGTIYIKSAMRNYNVQVYDAAGRFVLEKRKLSANQVIPIQLKNKAKGMYWVELRDTKSTIIRQVFIH